MPKHERKSKASITAEPAPTSQVRQYTEKLRDYVQDHKRSLRLFSWGVAERLHPIQQALGEGSSEFGAFMKNLGSVKKGGVGVPEKSGYRYLSKYKESIDLFPKPVIEALLAENILPSKSSILEGAASSEAIRTELNTIRTAIEQNQTQFIPGLCSAVVVRIEAAGKGAGRSQEPLYVSVSDSLCRRFRSLLAPYDRLIKSGKVELPKKSLRDDELREQATALAKGLMLTLMRCQSGGYFPAQVGPVFTQVAEIAREDFQLGDREV
jgi:hypothetical protein